jgi:hypothetical protein
LLSALAVASAWAQPAQSRELTRAHAWSSEPILRFQRGDDPAWAAPGFDDRAWPVIRHDGLPSRDGIFWIRARITLSSPGELDALAVAAISAYEVYWDGEVLGQSGRVGRDAGSEIPGPLDQVFALPAAWLAPGEHTVAFRLSSFHTSFPDPTHSLIFGPTTQREYYTARSRAAAISVVTAGGAFVLGVFNVLLGVLVRRRTAPLLFGLVCLAGALMQAMQSSRLLVQYPYSWHYARVLGFYFSVALMVILLLAFVGVFLRVPRLGWWLGGLALVALALPFVGIPGAAFNLALLGGVAIGLAMGLAAWAAWRREPWAVLILAGLAVTAAALWSTRSVLPNQLLVQPYGPAVLGCLVALTLQLRADRQAALQAQMTATRLEIELLKKNIQPHFLLNTLTTLMEVIEHEPKVAVGLIEALAAEFRLLARMSGERLVPLKQELELCREHLRVMSLRQDVRYSLRTENVSEDSLVPPALFLTLVENGVTHVRARGGTVEFALIAQVPGETESFTFTTPLGARARNAGHQLTRAAVVEGTGSRYIKARLEESFPGRWKFASGPTAAGWETTIAFQREGSGDRRT